MNPNAAAAISAADAEWPGGQVNQMTEVAHGQPPADQECQPDRPKRHAPDKMPFAAAHAALHRRGSSSIDLRIWIRAVGPAFRIVFA